VPAATIRNIRNVGNPWTSQLQAFRMDVSPVSNREFLAFVQAHPQWQKSQIPRDQHDGNYLKHWEGDDRVPTPELEKPVRYVSYDAAAAYCAAQGAKLPSLNQYRVAANTREGALEITYETAYAPPAFHFMQAEWTNTWWGAGSPDHGKRLPYMYGTIHTDNRSKFVGGDYSPEQEKRHTGSALGFRCVQY
jgi:formylglycine-generating enzyme required for sulfatase activity